VIAATMTSAPPLAPRSLGDILYLIVSAAWYRRYLLCVPIAVMPLLAFGISALLPKSYEARMTILVQEPAKLNPFLNDLAVGPNLKDRMEGLKALLRSEHVLAAVIRERQLLPADATPAARNWAVREMSGNLTATLVGGDLIELRLRGATPTGLDQVLATIGERFVDRLLAPERSSMEGSVTFLEREITEKRRILTEAEGALADFKLKNADKLPELYSANVQRLTMLQRTLEEKRAELATAKSAFDDLRARLANTNPVIGKMEEQIVQVSGELALLRARYTDDHSDVQAALRKVRRLEDERKALIDAAQTLTPEDIERLIEQASTQGVSSDRPAAPLLISQMQRLQDAKAKQASISRDVASLEQTVAQVQASVGTYGTVEREQHQLDRRVLAAREMHDSLAKRYEMARVTGALGKFEAPERVKLIDPPTAPLTPTTPPAILFVIGGIIGGIALGAALAFAAELADTSLRRREQIESGLGLPLLSRLPGLHRMIGG